MTMIDNDRKRAARLIPDVRVAPSRNAGVAAVRYARATATLRERVAEELAICREMQELLERSLTNRTRQRYAWREYANRIEGVLRDCLAETAAPNFTDRHGLADKIRAVLPTRPPTHKTKGA